MTDHSDTDLLRILLRCHLSSSAFRQDALLLCQAFVDSHGAPQSEPPTVSGADMANEMHGFDATNPLGNREELKRIYASPAHLLYASDLPALQPSSDWRSTGSGQPKLDELDKWDIQDENKTQVVRSSRNIINPQESPSTRFAHTPSVDQDKKIEASGAGRSLSVSNDHATPSRTPSVNVSQTVKLLLRQYYKNIPPQTPRKIRFFADNDMLPNLHRKLLPLLSQNEVSDHFQLFWERLQWAVEQSLTISSPRYYEDDQQSPVREYIFPMLRSIICRDENLSSEGVDRKNSTRPAHCAADKSPMCPSDLGCYGDDHDGRVFDLIHFLLEMKRDDVADVALRRIDIALNETVRGLSLRLDGDEFRSLPLGPDSNKNLVDGAAKVADNIMKQAYAQLHTNQARRVVVMTWNVLLIFELRGSCEVAVSKIVRRGADFDEDAAALLEEVLQDIAKTRETKVLSVDCSLEEIRGKLPQPTIISTLAALTLCPLDEPPASDLFIRLPATGMAVGSRINPSTTSSENTKPGGSKTSAGSEAKGNKRSGDSTSRRGTTREDSDFQSIGDNEAVRSKPKRLLHLSDAPALMDYYREIIQPPVDPQTIIVEDLDIDLSNTTLWRLNNDLQLSTDSRGANILVTSRPRGLSLRLTTCEPQYIARGRLWEVYAADLHNWRDLSPIPNLSENEAKLLSGNNLEDVSAEVDPKSTTHAIDSPPLIQPWETALTPEDFPRKVVLKACIPSLMGPLDTNGNKTYRYDETSALEAIRREVNLYTGPLSPLGGTVIPRFYGLYMVQVELGDELHDVYIMLLERLGVALGHFEGLTSGQRVEIIRLYTQLHEVSVIHVDLASRHILSAFPPDSAYPDSMALHHARRQASWEPGRVHYRLIDFEGSGIGTESEIVEERENVRRLLIGN